MPVRSLNSSVIVWPDARTVDRAVRRWARKLALKRPEVLRIGYFGSYARGDWGVGSDLDLVIVVERAELPFVRRAVQWDTSELPVPADVLVYERGEWEKVKEGRFARTLQEEVIWVYIREP